MDQERQKSNSKIVLAFFLITIGVMWGMVQMGIHFNFHWVDLAHIFYPLKEVFHHLGRFLFTWPMILIFIGGVLMAGKRPFGLILVIVGGIFLIPKLFFFPGLSISFAIPVFLVALGIAMVARFI